MVTQSKTSAQVTANGRPALAAMMRSDGRKWKCAARASKNVTRVRDGGHREEA